MIVAYRWDYASKKARDLAEATLPDARKLAPIDSGEMCLKWIHGWRKPFLSPAPVQNYSNDNRVLDFKTRRPTASFLLILTEFLLLLFQKCYKEISKII